MPLQTKNYNTRLDEAMAFLRTVDMPYHAEMRVEVLNAVDDWYLNATPPQKQAISGFMSQSGSANRGGTVEARNYARAAIFLDCAIRYPNTPAEWPKMQRKVAGWSNSPNVKLFFTNQLAEVRDAVFSSRSVATRHIQNFQEHPVRWLNKYRLLVSTGSSAEVKPFGFFMVDGKYNLDAGTPGRGQVQVNALCLIPVTYNNVKAHADQVPATSTAGRKCDLVLTTQFTGCSYCFSIQNGELTTAHIEPGRGTTNTGSGVSNDMRTNGAFAGGKHADFKAYGRVDLGSAEFGYQACDQMIAIGMKRPGSGWRIYAQMASNNTLTAKRIG